MVRDVEDTMDRVGEITELSPSLRQNSSMSATLAGVVCFQGYADAFESEYLSQYAVKLETWIVSVRDAFSLIPGVSSTSVVISQMGEQGLENSSEEEQEMRIIQENFVTRTKTDGVPDRRWE